MGLLFKDEDLYEENNDPIDDPEITQVIIYLGKEDAIMFKKLCKEGMKIMFPGTYIDDGNMSVLLFNDLKEKYGHLIPKTQKTVETAGSGETEGNLSGSE